jgi:hypothetical protein
MPFDATRFEGEVLRAEDGPSGGPLQTHNRIGDDVLLRALISARHRLDDPSRWNHSGGYFEVFGMGVMACTDATAACAVGSVRIVTGDDNRIWERAWDLFDDLLGRSVFAFNDHPTTTHADVLALFDRAIASRRAELGVSP